MKRAQILGSSCVLQSSFTIHLNSTHSSLSSLIIPFHYNEEKWNGMKEKNEWNGSEWFIFNLMKWKCDHSTCNLIELNTTKNALYFTLFPLSFTFSLPSSLIFIVRWKTNEMRNGILFLYYEFVSVSFFSLIKLNVNEKNQEILIQNIPTTIWFTSK